MKKTLREFIKLARKCRTRAERVELLQNLLADLINKMVAASDRSGDEIIATMKSVDRTYREFSKHPDTYTSFRLDPHGFRSCFAAHLVGGDAEYKGKFIFEWARWDWAAAIAAPEPWETLPADEVVG